MTLKPLYIYILVAFLITLFLRIVLVGYYDFNLGGIEPNVVYGIQRILLGQPLYQDPSAGSYAIIQYTPLWYYSVAAIARLISADSYQHGLDVQGIYVLCRTLALICNLLTVGVCALIIRSWRFSWLQSFAFAMPVLIILTAHYYTRGDSLHLVLFAAALWCYFTYSKKGGVSYVLLSAFFSAACIMTKQSGLLVTIIIGPGFLFMERKYFMAAMYMGTVAACSLLIARCCNNGDWLAFYQNAVLGLKNGVDPSFLYTIFISRFFLDLVPCYFLGFIMLIKAWRPEDKTYRLILWGICCSWLFAVITGLKIGSSNNYFTEFLLLLLIGLPLLLHNRQGSRNALRVSGHSFTTYHFAIIVFLILITSKTAGMVSAIYFEKTFRNDRQEYVNEQALYAWFQDSLHIKEGQHVFFTERRYLDNIFIKYSVMPVKDVISQAFKASPTTFNYTGFSKGINNGAIQYIVTDVNRDDINICNDSLPFTWFDKSKFKLVAHMPGYSIYAWSPEGSL